MKIVEPSQHLSLDNYAAHAHLRASVVALQADAEQHVRALRDRTIWMLNSTAQGGGVAELLPAQISLLQQLGLDVRWAVLETENADFFKFTKRLHNLVHGAPEALPTNDDRELYEAVNRSEAEAFARLAKPGDLLVVHDPQPLALGAVVKKQLGLRCIWRCHIGVDEETPGTRAAWTFMRPYAEQYDATVFSVADYIPAYLRDRSLVIHPSIDPLSHKNRDLSLHKLVGVLGCSDLVEAHWPLMCPPFPQPARRLQADGSLRPATTPEDFGLLARPIITQVSRWDRLKGFAPLLDAFVQLKIGNHAALRDERHGRRLRIVRLVLAGADPDSIADDPEAHAVFAELRAKYCALSPEVQQDIAIIALPIESRKNNALMVNALQRAADIIVQNSLREGFGLTVAEGMWKRSAVLGSAAACGVRLQVRDGMDGRLINNPENVSELTEAMVEMLADPTRLEEYGRNAQYRVHDQFLIFSELRQWLGVFNSATFRK
ncbi:MAG TPA: glycosyltransferase [Longimicrobiales bacterium]|nr:glycosyltransferase [Longimicrobiales bacterium]